MRLFGGWVVIIRNSEYDLAMKKVNVILELTPAPFLLRCEHCLMQDFGKTQPGRGFANLLTCAQECRIKTESGEEEGWYVEQGKGKAVLEEETKSLACFAWQVETVRWAHRSVKPLWVRGVKSRWKAIQSKEQCWHTSNWHILVGNKFELEIWSKVGVRCRSTYCTLCVVPGI